MGNGEAAFQALKFWQIAEEFTDLSGEMAFEKQQSLRGQEDFFYGGFGDDWKAMLAVLSVKFKAQTACAVTLLQTGDAFILEHDPITGRDKIWSDNGDGEGTNWLGLQIMLTRDRLSGKREWTDYIASLIDTASGKAVDPAMELRWQETVRQARGALLSEVQSQGQRMAQNQDTES